MLDDRGTEHQEGECWNVLDRSSRIPGRGRGSESPGETERLEFWAQFGVERKCNKQDI